MEVGYSARCKVCNSEHRADVERRKSNGDSLSTIVAYLKEQGEAVSKAAIHRHFVEHFPVQQEAAKRYSEQSAVVMEEAVEKRLTDIQVLESVMQRQLRLHVLATESIEESMTTEFPVMLRNGKPLLDPDNEFKPVKRKHPPAKQIVDLANGSAAEIRQALKLKAELLGDKDPDGSTIIVIGAEDDDDS